MSVLNVCKCAKCGIDESDGDYYKFCYWYATSGQKGDGVFTSAYYVTQFTGDITSDEVFICGKCSTRHILKKLRLSRLIRYPTLLLFFILIFINGLLGDNNVLLGISVFTLAAAFLVPLVVYEDNHIRRYLGSEAWKTRRRELIQSGYPEKKQGLSLTGWGNETEDTLQDIERFRRWENVLKQK